MSLKAFHVFFILCAIFLMAWLAVLGIQAYGTSHGLGDLFLGVVFLLCAVGFSLYLLWFLKKSKKTNQS